MATAVVTLDFERFDQSRVESDVALAAAGNTAAFERLYRCHVARVHSLARRMTGGNEADEVTQDIFVRAWQKLGTFRGEAAFTTWLHRLAVNVILERRRRFIKDQLRMSADPLALAVVAAAPAPTDLTMDFELALQELPPGAREIFVLHDVEGYKHREIATLLDITSGTSKHQLHRARMLMRRHLGAR